MESQGPEVVQITPSPESLIIKHTKNHGVYWCSEDQCSFTTLSPSILGLHKANTHNITTGAKKKSMVHQYFCPGPGCYYNPQSGRFFKTLDTLRTHYMKLHTEKKFKCCKCDKAFGLERDLLYHEVECGQSFTCPDCGKTYNNRNALRMHCLSRRHKKPPELSSRPKASKPRPIPDRQKLDKNHLVPILPKLTCLAPMPPQPLTSPCIVNKTPIPGSAVKILLQSVVPSQAINIRDFNPPPLTVYSNPKTLCNSVTQTRNPLSSASSQTTIKCHAPTQTRLSILEKAMKSSKIPVTKTSKATQKSFTKPGPRKRKTTANQGTNPKRSKLSSRMTVATLTDPLLTPLTLRSHFSQNTQTVVSVNGNALKNVPLGAVQIQDKSSMSTQTMMNKPPFIQNHIQGVHSNFNYVSCPLDRVNQHVSGTFQCGSTDHNILTDSITQTLGSSEILNGTFSNSETQTSLKQSSSSNTQTQGIFALDSSTQTLKLNPHLDDTSDFLNELLTENERNDVDTQTFGSFFSDMMTQTLEQLVSEETSENNNSVAIDNIIGINNTTTQTFDETMDNVTQTFGSNIVDSMTQTNLRNDTTTQTFDNLGVDTTTQTFIITNDCGTQPCELQNLGYQTENVIVNSNDFAVQMFERYCSVPTQTSDIQSTILPEMSLTVTDNNFTQTANFDDGISRTSTLKPQTSTIGTLTQVSGNTSVMTMTQTQLPRSGHVSSQTVMNPLADSMTQTLYPECGDVSSQPTTNPLTDTMTQTLYPVHGDVSSQPTTNPLTDTMTQTLYPVHGDVSSQPTTNPLTDTMTQTLYPVHGDVSSQPTTNPLTDTMTQTLYPVHGDVSSQPTTNPLTDTMTQTLYPVHGDVSSQPTINPLTDTMTQTLYPVHGDVSSQPTTNPLTDTMTQTLYPVHGDVSSQPTINPLTDTMTQTLYPLHGDVSSQPTINPLTDTMTQTLSIPDEDLTLETLLSDMATQTFDNENFSFDDLLQSSEDFSLSSNLIPQTSIFNNTACQTPLLLSTDLNATKNNDQTIGVQTASSENGVFVAATANHIDNRENELWETGTQTAGDILWEMASQTENEEAGEIATQTGWGDSWDMAGDCSWETGTQTGAENVGEIGIQTGVEVEDLWEMGTQTGVDDIWEMGTQTGGNNNIWEMGTQTGGDDIWEMGTQTGGDDIWEMGTQTGGDDIWKIGTQTGGDDIWEMGTQTGGDDIWEMGTQTGGNNNIWEMGTQTGGDDIWEMGTQTGGEDLWEMGTQTGGDDIWEMGTQTGGDDIWEMGTQTGGDDIWEMGTQTGGDDIWKIGTQTGGDDIWEMGTQTGGDDIWEMGTQTGGNNNIWEMGTQTGGDDIWEMGTQTGGEDLWEMGTQTGGDDIWEMGTQTMDSLLTDTTTQTGDGLLDFLTVNSNVGFNQVTPMHMRLGCTQTETVPANNQTQISSVLSFSELGLFHDS